MLHLEVCRAMAASYFDSDHHYISNLIMAVSYNFIAD